METKHINHVVLYAKNFYRHTNNVVKDMQRFMQLDGHRYFQINTPEKVEKWMRKDFIKWLNSIEDPEIRKRYEDDVDGKVRWAEGPEATIWHYLICYAGSGIPAIGSQIGYPIYDQYHMPQFGVHEIDFRRTDSYEEMMAKAKKFLDTTHEDRFDDYMNRLMEDFDFENASKIFNELGEQNVTVEGLQDELWNDYTEFMDENVIEDGNIKPVCVTHNTGHFLVTYISRNYSVDINLEIILGEMSYSLEKSPAQVDRFEPIINKLFAAATDDVDAIDNIIIARKTVNKVLDNEEFWERHLNRADIIESFISNANSFVNEEYHYSKLVERGKYGFSTGGFDYQIIINPDSVELHIIATALFKCEIMEQELRNYTGIGFVHGEKY